jgi:transcriptional regulator with XRE-family HTH domain
MPNSKNALQMGINHELLKKLMQDKNLTPAVIEKRKGTPEQTVKNIINGKTGNPGIENLAPICEELGIRVEDVLFSRNKEFETKVLKEEPSAYNLKEMYEFQVSILNKAHETETNNIREHYEREVKAHEKEMNNMREHYERELKAQEKEMSNMREHYERQLKEKDNYYEKHISVIEAHYERRLADKREHIDTILIDKNWFRLAAVVGVMAVLSIFFFIEFATPGHGWFTFGENSIAPAFSFVAIILSIIIIVLIITIKKKKEAIK